MSESIVQWYVCIGDDDDGVDDDAGGGGEDGGGVTGLDGAGGITWSVTKKKDKWTLSDAWGKQGLSLRQRDQGTTDFNNSAITFKKPTTF